MNSHDPSDESISFRFESDFASGEVDTIFTDDEIPIRVLKVGNAFQSATFFGDRKNELPFEYFRRFSDALKANDDLTGKKRVLLLGAGACSLPKHILSEPESNVSIVAVERDPKIVDIAREYFYLDDLEEALAKAGQSNRLEIVIEDALEFLNSSQEVFSAIVNDLFHGESQDMSLADETCLKLIKDHLMPGGLYMINHVCDESAESFLGLRNQLDALKNVFGFAQAILATDEEFSDYDNYILVASTEDRVFENAIGEY